MNSHIIIRRPFQLTLIWGLFILARYLAIIIHIWATITSLEHKLNSMVSVQMLFLRVSWLLTWVTLSNVQSISACLYWFFALYAVKACCLYCSQLQVHGMECWVSVLTILCLIQDRQLVIDLILAIYTILVSFHYIDDLQSNLLQLLNRARVLPHISIGPLCVESSYFEVSSLFLSFFIVSHWWFTFAVFALYNQSLSIGVFLLLLIVVEFIRSSVDVVQEFTRAMMKFAGPCLYKVFLIDRRFPRKDSSVRKHHL